MNDIAWVSTESEGSVDADADPPVVEPVTVEGPADDETVETGPVVEDDMGDVVTGEPVVAGLVAGPGSVPAVDPSDSDSASASGLIKGPHPVQSASRMIEDLGIFMGLLRYANAEVAVADPPWQTGKACAAGIDLVGRAPRRTTGFHRVHAFVPEVVGDVGRSNGARRG